MAVIGIVFIPPFEDLAVPFLPFVPQGVADAVQDHAEYLCCGQQVIKLEEVKHLQPCRGRKRAEELSVGTCSETQRARALLLFILGCLGASASNLFQIT